MKQKKEESSGKESLKVLNAREKKEINKRIKEQWDCEIDKSLVFLLSNKNKLYVAEKDLGLVDFAKLRVDNIGLYVCTVSEKDIRLSIEGSQLLGRIAKKNVVEITKEEVRQWFRGEDIKTDVKMNGFVILKCGEDFVGCGRITEKGILNFVPKVRRVSEAIVKEQRCVV
jgi:NOL1/NOP2/fmu family ribosome biogenesis protein